MLSGSVVTTAWRVLRLQLVETASRCGGYLSVYCISSRRQSIGGGPAAWGLGGSQPHRKKNCNEILHTASDQKYSFRSVQSFGGKARRKETTRKTEA
jgi:hypothetical protein